MSQQEEIVQIIEAMQPAFIGHPRVLVLTALWRCMAAMLAPAEVETRERALIEMPIAIRNILREMDRMMQEGDDGR